MSVVKIGENTFKHINGSKSIDMLENFRCIMSQKIKQKFVWSPTINFDRKFNVHK